jgi:hypothetical protein
MPASASLRLQIERSLESRIPAALTFTQKRTHDLVSTGILEVDRVLEGGLPVGAISELTGPASSGKTTLAISFLAQRTHDGQVCAWVDVHDALDPVSAAASGVLLSQLLWVRCRESNQRGQSKPWPRLEQALRATDLLLQAGGFAAIVLDLAETKPEHACRIPLATWFRFRHAAHRARTALIVLGQDAYAQSSAELVLECSALSPIAEGDQILTGFHFEGRRKRMRAFSVLNNTKKPPASTWSANAPWDAMQQL